MTTEEIIARCKHRIGFRLADYAEVALPIYALNAQALTMAHWRMAPTDEFILKCLALNISSCAEMGRFLGLEEEVIKSALVSLAQSESIALTAPSGRQTWNLTSKGRAALDTAELISPEERMFPIHFDAITRKPTLYRFQKLLKYREAVDAGLKEIEQIPPRRPQLSEITPLSIERILKTTSGFAEQRRDLLAIRSLQNIRKLYVRALALIFRSKDGDEIQIGFVIDGKVSQEHELAFAGSEGFRRLPVALSLDSAEKVELEAVASIPLELSGPVMEAQQLAECTERAEAQIAETTVALAATENERGRKELREKLECVEAELKQLGEESRKLKIRNLYMADHPPLLDEALRTATTRLMIIVPWIRGNVVDADFIAKLERLLSIGVSVYIGYGIKVEPTRKLDPEDVDAMKRLKELSGRYGNFFFKRLGNTHAKVLLKDSDFVAVTSFNWLSFRGDPKKEFRDEQGILLQVPELIETKFAELEPRCRVTVDAVP